VTFTLTVETNVATSSRLQSFPPGASNSPERVPAHMPASVPADQLYYWTGAWREGEVEGLADLAAGRARDFTDPMDAIRYLVSPDDD
jgi:hypothetical protein